MLIRTETDENELPLDAVVILADGVAAQLDAYSGTITDESLRGRRFWRTTGSTYINSPLPDRFLPAALVSPRRYGDDDVERVAKAHYEWATKGRDYAPWENTDPITQDLYCRIAHTTLNALEDQ